MRSIGKAAVIFLAVLVLATAADAQSKRKREREREQAAPPPAPADKRDRQVAAPGTPFNGRPYWQAMAQCGGIYFKLNTLYSYAAIQAKVVKPDAAANAQFTKKSDAARRTATAFFEAAERLLIADRGVAREEAIMTYDARASDEGDRHKTIDAAELAMKPCPALYNACRQASPKICSEPAVSAGLPQAGSGSAIERPQDDAEHRAENEAGHERQEGEIVALNDDIAGQAAEPEPWSRSAR
jgi:hypothetical protein